MLVTLPLRYNHNCNYKTRNLRHNDPRHPHGHLHRLPCLGGALVRGQRPRCLHLHQSPKGVGLDRVVCLNLQVNLYPNQTVDGGLLRVVGHLQSNPVNVQNEIMGGPSFLHLLSVCLHPLTHLVLISCVLFNFYRLFRMYSRRGRIS